MFIMEGMGKQRRPRRAFTPEFKAEIVEVCRRGARTVGHVANDFDLTETAAREAPFEYIEGRYNTRKPHSISDYAGPVAYEATPYTKPPWLG
jgi:transposase-like protein